MIRTSGPDTCSEVREGLTEYLGDALSPRRRQGIDSHLATCPGCRSALGRLQRTLRHLSSLPGEPMPAGMKRTLLQAFRHHTPTGNEAGAHRP